MAIREQDRKKQQHIVDDFTNMRRTIKNMLKQIGFEHVSEADDGDTALEKMEAQNFHFVICDWNMPRMSGIHLLRAVRMDDRFKNIPFLMITAENWEEEIVEAAEESVDGYIIKPFVTKTLEDKIYEIIDKRKNPSEGEVIFQKGLEAYEKKKYPEAVITFNKVLEIKSNSAKAACMIGMSYMAGGKLDEAEESFKKALGFNKQFVKTYQGMAELMMKRGNTEEAIKNLEQAVALSPRISHRQLMLGNLFIQAKKYSEAIAPFKKGLENALQPEAEKEKIRKWIESVPENEKKSIANKLKIEL